MRVCVSVVAARGRYVRTEDFAKSVADVTITCGMLIFLRDVSSFFFTHHKDPFLSHLVAVLSVYEPKAKSRPIPRFDGPTSWQTESSPGSHDVGTGRRPQGSTQPSPSTKHVAALCEPHEHAVAYSAPCAVTATGATLEGRIAGASSSADASLAHTKWPRSRCWRNGAEHLV